MRYTSLPLGAAALLLLAGLSGCQGNERLEEKAGIEGAIAAKKQIEVDRQAAREAEEDLSKLQRYYQAIDGVYEGKLQIEKTEFSIRMVIKASPAAYKSTRGRSFDEVKTDLQKLGLTVLVSQWNPLVSKRGEGCQAFEVRPEVTQGEIIVKGPECSGIYSLRLAERLTSGSEDRTRAKELSAELARAVLDGKVDSVPHLIGNLVQVRNTEEVEFSLSRTR